MKRVIAILALSGWIFTQTLYAQQSNVPDGLHFTNDGKAFVVRGGQSLEIPRSQDASRFENEFKSYAVRFASRPEALIPMIKFVASLEPEASSLSQIGHELLLYSNYRILSNQTIESQTILQDHVLNELGKLNTKGSVEMMSGIVIYGNSAAIQIEAAGHLRNVLGRASWKAIVSRLDLTESAKRQPASHFENKGHAIILAGWGEGVLTDGELLKYFEEGILSTESFNKLMKSNTVQFTQTYGIEAKAYLLGSLLRLLPGKEMGGGTYATYFERVGNSLEVSHAAEVIKAIGSLVQYDPYVKLPPELRQEGINVVKWAFSSDHPEIRIAAAEVQSKTASVSFIEAIEKQASVETDPKVLKAWLKMFAEIPLAPYKAKEAYRSGLETPIHEVNSKYFTSVPVMMDEVLKSMKENSNLSKETRVAFGDGIAKMALLSPVHADGMFPYITSWIKSGLLEPSDRVISILAEIATDPKLAPKDELSKPKTRQRGSNIETDKFAYNVQEKASDYILNLRRGAGEAGALRVLPRLVSAGKTTKERATGWINEARLSSNPELVAAALEAYKGIHGSLPPEATEGSKIMEKIAREQAARQGETPLTRKSDDLRERLKQSSSEAAKEAAKESAKDAAKQTAKETGRKSGK